MSDVQTTLPSKPKVIDAVVAVAAAFKPSTRDKKWWQSKTLWVSAVVAGASFVPAVQAVAIANPEIVGLALGGVFALLRIITGGKVVIS